MDPFLGSVLSSLLSPLASLMNHITKHATYPFKVDDSVKALESTTRDLEVRMKDINIRIESAKRQGLTTMHQVERWLEQVEAIICESHDITGKYSNRSCKCAGKYSLNCCSNYSIGKRAAKELLEVQKLYDDGVFESVAVKLPPPLIQERSTSNTSRQIYEVLPSHIQEMPTTSNTSSHEVPPVQEIPTASSESSQVDSNLQTALHYLDDDTVTKIGIWGMGGVGKTHLLNQLKDSFYLGNSRFDVVTLVTVSKECSIPKVQQEIISNLGLDRYCNDVQKDANTICNFLTNRSFLLLIDDLWGPLDLKKAGVPSGPYNQKVVLTTRSDEVCGAMKVKRQIKVNLLDEDSAWSLFQENVGEDTLSSDPFIPTLAKEIVKELGGLPLALITIGRAMHAKKHYRAWEDVLELLKESRLNEIEHRPYTEERTTFQVLKFSYESLESDTLRQCFLSCSMWPEDYKIQKEELIQCWIGLGLVNVSRTLRRAYNAGYTSIDKLQAACLLESTGYDGETVKMHDVLRDMALWIARDDGENNNKWIVKEEIEQACYGTERISLMKSKIRTYHFPYGTFPPLTKLTTLILQGYKLHETTLANIMAFYALTYLDLYNNSLHEFPVEICKLDKLQYLNLGGNSFGSLPKELKSLTSLKYLHLRGNLIHTISKGAFSELNALQVLDLFNTLDRNSSSTPMIINLPSLLEELKSLNNLRALGITVAGESQFQQLQRSTDLPFQSIGVHSLKESALSLTTNFSGSFVNYFEISDSITEQILIKSSGQNAYSHLDLERLRFLNMKCLDTIVWKGVSPRDLFPKLRRLQFSVCYKLKNVSWIVHLPCLWELVITGCLNMKYLISSTEDNHGENFVAEIQGEGRDILIPTFPCLKIMALSWLPKLQVICDPGVTFPSLRYLKIIKCHELKKLPFQPHNIPSKLEKIECQRSTWEAFEWEEDTLRESLENVCTLIGLV